MDPARGSPRRSRTPTDRPYCASSVGTAVNNSAPRSPPPAQGHARKAARTPALPARPARPHVACFFEIRTMLDQPRALRKQPSPAHRPCRDRQGTRSLGIDPAFTLGLAEGVARPPAAAPRRSRRDVLRRRRAPADPPGPGAGADAQAGRPTRSAAVSPQGQAHRAEKIDLTSALTGWSFSPRTPQAATPCSARTGRGPPAGPEPAGTGR